MGVTETLSSSPSLYTWPFETNTRSPVFWKCSTVPLTKKCFAKITSAPPPKNGNEEDRKIASKLSWALKNM